MKALIFDKSKFDWDNSKGFEKVEIPQPVLDKNDEDKVILKVLYAGVCGTDRGIWYRQAFKEAILGSIDEQIKHRGKAYRVIGHEFFGEVLEIGSGVKDIKIGEMISCESHVVDNKCFQCLNGQKNVCTNEKILGISIDGGFAEYAKVPAQVAWKTDINKIRPEVAVMQEPFGNAVHAASKLDLKGKTVAIFGLGPIGSFLVLVAKGMGAKKIIGIEPNDKAIDMGRRLGVDEIIKIGPSKDIHHDNAIIEKIFLSTNGLGVDVAFEMAGYNNSVNNAIASVRRGGDVILFGLKTGDFVFEDFNRLVMKGIDIHCVAGRQIWGTWEITKKLMENKKNGVQEKLWNVLLNCGKGTILDFKDYSKELFEQKMLENPKILLKF
jgi:threonine 3-dehydrogenase